jgi:hypothetical protein
VGEANWGDEMTEKDMESETVFETISRDAIWAHREGVRWTRKFGH